MNPQIVIFGADGFLGTYLARHYERQGREVVRVVRQNRRARGEGMVLEWDGVSIGPWALALEGAERVINLAGRSVNCRYDDTRKREIMRSRIDTTRLIGEAIAGCKIPPKLWLNASTATWYRHAEDCAQDEWSGEPGSGFSCEVAQAWEEAFFATRVPGATRKVALRIGMVMANETGTVFDVLSRLTRRGLAGAMGKGNQRVSWIHMDDLLAGIDFIAADPFLDGVFNLTAPEFPTNRELLRAFRRLEGVPFGIPAPAWAMEVGARLMGTETELVLKSRWVDPRRLRDEGFVWRWPLLDEALADLDKRPGTEGFFRRVGQPLQSARLVGWEGLRDWQPLSRAGEIEFP
ncbi:MAG: TIGR01777 family protein [Verrucomicrobia bacterium]|nr:MAG: TIGR01777 family protein [Verrucomicrobiota bacterium]TAE89411.1 MAG: TIGR01777 family protein [Verrucomicrobiota bacterium]TAF28090.1 MAG: TIGR01777 family protein [Verrucomicrobiota bacterium]TAF42937.1 MAG: TIGR01777 family protein [Verrucomicrobiota bacterium]